MRQALGALFASVLVLGCAPSGPRPTTQSQLQVRQFQTRSYDTKDRALVMKALLNVLQDEHFTVKTSNTDLGLITGDKVESTDHWVFIFVVPGTREWECTVNITDFGRETKVRVNVRTTAKGGLGNVLDVHEIDDPAYYRDFFSKVDKGIFIQKEKL